MAAVPMNLIHRWICQSEKWADRMHSQVLPWACEGVELNQNVLEIGPGYGVTTRWLMERAAELAQSKSAPTSPHTCATPSASGSTSAPATVPSYRSPTLRSTSSSASRCCTICPHRNGRTSFSAKWHEYSARVEPLPDQTVC